MRPGPGVGVTLGSLQKSWILHHHVGPGLLDNDDSALRHCISSFGSGATAARQERSSHGTAPPVIFDAQDRACVYLRYSTWHQADIAARHVQGLLVTTQVCQKR
jgi:hypothetical protein